MNPSEKQRIDRETLEKVKDIFTAFLERKKLRKTPERFTILEEIYSINDHFDVESLFANMKLRNYRVSRATLYNTLELLVDCGLVTRHQFGQNLAQYERAFGYKQHDHLICTECHRVMEFCDPRIQNIQQMVGDLMNFDVLHHTLYFYGKCQTTDCEWREQASVKD